MTVESAAAARIRAAYRDELATRIDVIASDTGRDLMRQAGDASIDASMAWIAGIDGQIEDVHLLLRGLLSAAVGFGQIAETLGAALQQAGRMMREVAERELADDDC